MWPLWLWHSLCLLQHVHATKCDDYFLHLPHCYNNPAPWKQTQQSKRQLHPGYSMYNHILLCHHYCAAQAQVPLICQINLQSTSRSTSSRRLDTAPHFRSRSTTCAISPLPAHLGWGQNFKQRTWIFEDILWVLSLKRFSCGFKSAKSLSSSEAARKSWAQIPASTVPRSDGTLFAHLLATR